MLRTATYTEKTRLNFICFFKCKSTISPRNSAKRARLNWRTWGHVVNKTYYRTCPNFSVINGLASGESEMRPRSTDNIYFLNVSERPVPNPRGTLKEKFIFKIFAPQKNCLFSLLCWEEKIGRTALHMSGRHIKKASVQDGDTGWNIASTCIILR